MWIVRPARPVEASLLASLSIRSKAHWGYDELFLQACAAELSITAQEIAEHPTFVLELDARVLGFYALEVVDDERVELSYLFVAPEQIGRGYGRALLDHAKAQVVALERHLMIIQGDPHAAHFYEAAGGRRVGTRPSASVAGRALPLFEIELGGAPT